MTLHRQFVAERETMRARYPQATLQAVADGAKDNWRIIDEIAVELGCDVHETLDYHHTAEHVTVGLRAAGASDDEVAAWTTTLPDGPDAPSKVIEELTVRSGNTGRSAVETELKYLIGHAERINHADTKAAHHPIGSGVQEAV